MRKIGELKGKPIIDGNPNEIKNNQIHIKTEEGGGITLSERKNGNLETISGGSSANKTRVYKYYKVAYNTPQDIIEAINILLSGYFYGVTTWFVSVDGIEQYGEVPFKLQDRFVDRYIRIVINDYPIAVSIDDSGRGWFSRVQEDTDLFALINVMVGDSLEALDYFKQFITEITKDEYYFCGGYPLNYTDNFI